MAKYRKKPVIVEAIQLIDNDEILAKISSFMGKAIMIDHSKRPITLNIETLEGTMIATEYDYIIKGVNGEFYPCKPDIFEKTYEKAETGYAGTDKLSEDIPKGTYWIGDNQGELVNFNGMEKVISNKHIKGE